MACKFSLQWEIQNDFKMTTKTAYTTLVTSKSYTLVLVYYSHHLR